MDRYRLIDTYTPRGDQPQAIAELVEGVGRGEKHQVLLGVTGSGKTLTVANVIAQSGRPALVLAHNKTLAAQLFSEFRELFPDNAVEYFVSYYDYYQPEAYIPRSDTYIEKDSSVNERIDRLRHSATRSLLTRRDVIIVASVSCIYGLGSPHEYNKMLVVVNKGDRMDRDQLMRRLIEMQYTRNDIDFFRGTFRARGDVLEIFPAYEDEKAIRIEFFDEDVERIAEIDPLRGKVIRDLPRIGIFPNSHYVADRPTIERAIADIRAELKERCEQLLSLGKLLEEQRLREKTLYDIEMLAQLGYCSGVENYSRHLDGREAGSPPWTLLDYFPSDFLTFIDESHQTVPQLNAMYNGDRSRKTVLVEYGFRLPSALDNRPLRFEEIQQRFGQIVYVSATPAAWELEKAGGVVVEQIIRPTGLMDPRVEVRPAGNQVDDLLDEIKARIDKNERVLVTTLTKRMAEDLTTYYQDLGLPVRYLHREIDTLERVAILRDLRLGEFAVLVGINLLREGLDLPEVSLVAILDADKEGFLRSTTSLLQTIGRAARNVNGTVILYADRMTASMSTALDETNRRRETQRRYNTDNGITPESIVKGVSNALLAIYDKDYVTVPTLRPEDDDQIVPAHIPMMVESLRRQMKAAAKSLDFERAAELRDQIKRLEEREIVGL
ncbi:MAG: excinuclease ABC subunit UvrB [Deltaproteobacteria bacterium]|nr:excinuclease ABC subunit UvrB [Deltaproteobacteria bacterium]